MKKSKKDLNQKKKRLERKKKLKSLPHLYSEQIEDEYNSAIPFPKRTYFNDWNELEFK